MRESNLNMHVFCEPLHNELFLGIHREQHLEQCGHGYSTTNEYVEQEDKFLKGLRQMHPLIGDDVFTFRVNEVINYLKIFESLDKPVILQPNRMHFIISDIAKAFDCKVAHLIRHPLDVFNSVMFSSPKLKYLQKTFHLNPYALRLLRKANQYFVEEQCNFISRYFGLISDKTPYLNKYLYPKRYLLRRFLLAWTIANWYAVKEIEAANGMVVRYEDIVDGDALRNLASFSGLPIDATKVILHHRSIRKYSNKDLDLCYMVANQMGILDKFRYLVEKFNYI